jgi:hypothetical protein
MNATATDTPGTAAPATTVSDGSPTGASDSRTCWIGVTSSDHVALALAGGFVQLNHGKAGPVERMRVGDAFAYYSPRTSYPDGDSLQAFTALGRVTGDAIFQADMGGGFLPFRRAVSFLPASPAPIRPLLEALTFVRSKTHWGAAFRFGFLRVPAADFARIAAAMGRDFAADFGKAEVSL